MAEQAKAGDRKDDARAKRPGLAFIDHDRQDYADRVAVPCDGDFLIGDYQDGGGVGQLGEFKIQLHYLGDRNGMLPAQLCVFGDGAAAFAVLLDLAGGDLGRLLSPVINSEEFSRRLLDLGLRDASHTPLGEGR
jgi:hypothetical protein